MIALDNYYYLMRDVPFLIRLVHIKLLFKSTVFVKFRGPKTWSCYVVISNCLDSSTQYDSSIQGQLCSDIDSTRPSAQRNDRKGWGLSSKPLDKKPYCPHTRSCDGITQFIPPPKRDNAALGRG